MMPRYQIVLEGEIERVYGEGKTVSTYIYLLRHDRRVGHHPDLRYFFLFFGEVFPRDRYRLTPKSIS